MQIETILLVDDDSDQLGTIARGLKLKGYDIYQALSAELGLELIKSMDTRIDLVITDYLMPEMDGLEFVTRIKENNINIPVIMMTAYLEKGLIARALDNQCAAFIEKPFTAEQLVEEIVHIEKMQRWDAGLLISV